MLIESRTIVGAAATFAVVGAALWGSALMMTPPNSGHVEVHQVQERSWAVEVKDLGFEQPASEPTKTAAVNR